ncbi:Methylthioribose-1-phosphate isomerase [Erysiphe neolycopersici]|uniref:Methylthioribose-1-phosphate isomerase n=1 Tax=Erysiphe neolycopersici TaxID=212602 RepID=A0A420HEJ1_9PEZI|nr:Methylthioribose-1-phosphate isomerase [Erysiphe neolycopersici]
MDALQAIVYSRNKLEVLDQLRLPHEIIYDNILTCEDAFKSIVSMRVRGAPAIALVGILSLAIELEQKRDGSTIKEDLISYIDTRLDYILGSRPTAVDLSNAIKTLKEVSHQASLNCTSDSLDACNEIRELYIKRAEKILEDDLLTNLAIGKFGAEYLKEQLLTADPTPINEEDPSHRFVSLATEAETDRRLSVLTHCNTGSLATSGHGTALGIIRSLKQMNYLKHAFFTETRPYNQGSRLTAFELIHESIPSTLITDSMVGALFAQKKYKEKISAVVVGADRVARNGDTANKIGTYSLAVLARYHGIKFVVAAPTTSIDLNTETGASIKIEERKSSELTQVSGPVIDYNGQVDTSQVVRIAMADQRANVWNPAFDVTPCSLIDAIITERGIVHREFDKFDFSSILSDR